MIKRVSNKTPKDPIKCSKYNRSVYLTSWIWSKLKIKTRMILTILDIVFNFDTGKRYDFRKKSFHVNYLENSFGAKVTISHFHD